MAPRWQAAWWPKTSRGGAMFGSEHGSTLASSVVAETSRGGAMFGSEHGSTLASSVVAGVGEVISATVATAWRMTGGSGAERPRIRSTACAGRKTRGCVAGASGGAQTTSPSSSICSRSKTRRFLLTGSSARRLPVTIWTTAFFGETSRTSMLAQYGMLEKGFSYAFAVGGLAAGWLADKVSVRWLYPLVLFARSAAGRHCQAAGRHCQAAPPCLASGTEGRSVPRSSAPDTSCPLGTAAST